MADHNNSTTKKEEKENVGNDSILCNNNIPPTDVVYLTYNGNFELECDARVLQIETTTTSNKKESGKDNKNNNDSSGSVGGDGGGGSSSSVQVSIKLDKTVMHAQGGGQPTDIGTMVLLTKDDTNNNNGNNSVIHINKVLMDRNTGIVTHTGTQLLRNNNNNNNNKTTTALYNDNNAASSSSSSSGINMGDFVRVKVNKEHRRILSECHTAGHVVDSAMEKIGKSAMKPTKGYHFLDGPYVEYKGSIPVNERESTLKRLQTAYQELVDENISTKIDIVSKEQANELCNNRITWNFDMDMFSCQRTNTVRVVTVAGYPCPCGGTHVSSTMDLKQNKWGIMGIKSKKGVVRIKYGQNTY